MTHHRIAIVGMACRYPDARSPVELWENVLAGRRAFRRIPRERLRLDDYWSEDRLCDDATYGTCAAVIDGYRFDRLRFRVSAETYDSVDMAHWLALEVAGDALADAGFPDGAGFPGRCAGVLVGNTLTGEFSRAAALRLRWPYVRRVLDIALDRSGEPARRRGELLGLTEALFKAPFPAVNAETLAGGLSNTIAGRISNHFNLQGGGFTVDGACASSLLAVAHGCSALVAGDLDFALAGGVDLSLDPFELVGFAKAGALATDDMRVYDAMPTGFWPGEGCGFVVLMREADAVAQQRRIYAVIPGWGVSSDGRGGMTRPELEGQLLALDRAYARAEFHIGTVGMFEGHGTGTAVGDATELNALSTARRRADPAAPATPVGSIKANIGHTKAAAGVAGLLKAAMAVHHHVIPPTSGCRDPHPLLTGSDALLRTPLVAEPWPDARRRAGVSAMGFGGINVHVVLEGDGERHQGRLNSLDRRFSRARQDAELFLFAADDSASLCDQIDRLIDVAAGLSLSELADVAVQLQRNATRGRKRAAMVARTPAELDRLLRKALGAARAGRTLFDLTDGAFVDFQAEQPRIGYLFTGQGAPARTDGAAWSTRFDEVADLYRAASWPRGCGPADTALAQPAIVTASCAALRVLGRVGMQATVGIGHSLGELTALFWAGAFSEADVLAMAKRRGELMSALEAGPGAMVALACSPTVGHALVSGTGVVVAAINALDRVVASGPLSEIEELVGHAARQGLYASRLPVAHAFHSPLMTPVVPAFRAALETIRIAPLERTVISTVTGAPIGAADDVRQILERQVLEPVRFLEALRAAPDVDLFIEVGPGHSVAALAGLSTNVPVLSIEAGHTSLRPLMLAIGAAFTLGADIDARALGEGRFARPLDLSRPREFFVNPCEKQLEGASAPPITSSDSSTSGASRAASADVDAPVGDSCALLRSLVSQRAQLPAEAITAESRFLSDLHLNSITVSEILNETAKRLHLPVLTAPTDYADATLAAAAAALDTIRATGPVKPAALPDGLESWVRAFDVRWEACPLPKRFGRRTTKEWRIVAAPGHPLGEPLRARFQDGAAGSGTLVCIDAGRNPSHELLLAAARRELRTAQPGAFVIVQQDAGFSGFARTLLLESRGLDVTVVTLDFADPRAVDHVHAEACAAAGFTEVRYAASAQRLIPVAHVWPLEPDENAPRLTEHDVLLVTGGGKGIGAECALGLSKATGIRLALIGRSLPDEDRTLAANLQRMRAAGATVVYVPADVSDPDSVFRAIQIVRTELGDVTAVLHAAGVNEPALIAALDTEKIAAAFAAKVDGARHVTAAVNPARLKAFISFGSVIARTGLPGEAHYALANERLREMTDQMANAVSSCRWLTVEWSVWAAAGMGERLGRLEGLARDGVMAIDISTGVALLQRLLTSRLPGSAVVAAGRLGARSTLTLSDRELPFARFLESVRVHVPSVELVADSELSVSSDPYLPDHRLEGQMVFPGVMGLEAMVQASTALAGARERLCLEDVEFARPIVVPDSGSLVLRTVALREPDGRIRVALRSSATDFRVDHFRAVCTSFEPADGPLPWFDYSRADVDSVNPAADLYGSLFFQSGRFARVRAYRHLLATECAADIEAQASQWFGPHLPGALVLGDPGARDAALHSVQACIPQRRLVPTSVTRIRILKPLSGMCRISARQVSAIGDEFIWDLAIVDEAGHQAEIWEGVRLRGIQMLPLDSVRVPLLGPYIERRLPALGHEAATRVLMRRSPGRAESHVSSEIVGDLFGDPAQLYRRPDGKPETANGGAISVAHTGTLTLVVASPAAVGCDLETVRSRTPQVWTDLLGPDRASLAELIAREQHEVPAAGATRVWAAVESLKKAGAPPGTSLMFRNALADGWVTLQAGRYSVSTWVGVPAGHEQIALAIATGDSHAWV